MNLDGFDMGSLNDIINSLSDEDIESLKGMASSFFSQQGSEKEAPKEKKQGQKGKAENPFDLESLAKIASLMGALQSDQKDPRCELLYALRPMLKEERQQRIDQAAKMIQLFSLIPKLKELNL